MKNGLIFPALAPILTATPTPTRTENLCHEKTDDFDIAHSFSADRPGRIAEQTEKNRMNF